MKNLISIVIPTHSRPQWVRRLAESIDRQNLDQISIEVLVVSNFNEIGLRQLVNEQGDRYRYLEVGQLGVNRARNLGIRHAAGEIILFLDDDCELKDPLFLRNHLERHRHNPMAVAIGGPYDLPADAGAMAEAYHWIARLWLAQSRTEGYQTRHLLGGNCSFKTDFIKYCFSFDDAIVFGGSETELQDRLTQAGHVLLCFDELKVVHRPHVNLPILAKKAYAQGFGQSQNLKFKSRTYRFASELLTMDQYTRRSGIQLRKSVWLWIWFYRTCFDEGQKAGLNHAASSRWSGWLYFRIALITAKEFFKKQILPFTHEIYLLLTCTFKSRAAEEGNRATQNLSMPDR